MMCPAAAEGACRYVGNHLHEFLEGIMSASVGGWVAAGGGEHGYSDPGDYIAIARHILQFNTAS